jgi:hypothetical protein
MTLEVRVWGNHEAIGINREFVTLIIFFETVEYLRTTGRTEEPNNEHSIQAFSIGSIGICLFVVAAFKVRQQ